MLFDARSTNAAVIQLDNYYLVSFHTENPIVPNNPPVGSRGDFAASTSCSLACEIFCHVIDGNS